MSNSPSITGVAPKRRKRRTWIYLLAAVLVVAALSIGVAMKNASKRNTTLVTTDTADVRTITQVVSATGKVQPEVEVKIAPEVAGEILEMPLREGAAVRRGDLLVRIKSDNYRFQVDQQEAGLAAARAASLDAKVRLAKAEEDYQRSLELSEKRLVSASELTAAKTAFEAAQAGYESSLAQIRRAEGTLRQAQDQLEKTVIFAPMDGTISSRTSEVGERVAGTGQYGGAEIMRVADLSNMEVRVNVNETDIVNVKPGDTARVAIDAFPGRRFAGVVKEIASAAKTTGQMTQEEVTNFQVKVRIVDKDVPLRPGMSATVDIETKTVENVVAVPIQCVTARTREGGKTVVQQAEEREKKDREAKGEGAAAAVNERERRERERADRDALQRVVFRREGDAVKMVPVVTGIADTTHMEIVSGLAAGDEVVSGSYTVITRTLTDGMKVRVEPPKAKDAKP